jgi:hypothetical protein
MMGNKALRWSGLGRNLIQTSLGWVVPALPQRRWELIGE